MWFTNLLSIIVHWSLRTKPQAQILLCNCLAFLFIACLLLRAINLFNVLLWYFLLSFICNYMTMWHGFLFYLLTTLNMCLDTLKPISFSSFFCLQSIQTRKTHCQYTISLVRTYVTYYFLILKDKQQTHRCYIYSS